MGEIEKNRKKSNSDFLEGIQKDVKIAKNFSNAVDGVPTRLLTPKATADDGLDFLDSVCDLIKKRNIDKNVLNEETLFDNYKDELNDVVSNFAKLFLDVIPKVKGTPISRNLYAPLKEESVDKAKNIAVEASKQVL